MAFMERLLASGFMHHATGYSDVYELSITYIAQQGARILPQTTSSSSYHSAPSAVVHAFSPSPSVVALIHSRRQRRRCRWGFGAIRGWQCTGVSDPSRLMLDRRETSSVATVIWPPGLA